MERELNIGDAVRYTDEHAVEHFALVTQTWLYGKKLEEHKAQHGQYPSLNLVFVVLEASKSDPYGHQIERPTSVVHKNQQAAPGRFWRFLDE
jgi:hypothetical protein